MAKGERTVPAFEGILNGRNAVDLAKAEFWKRIKERNEFIMVLRRQGYSDRVIGERVGLSGTRVHQIRMKQNRIQEFRMKHGWPQAAAALAAAELNLMATIVIRRKAGR